MAFARIPIGRVTPLASGKDPAEAAVVQHIYTTYLHDGQSLHGLTKSLMAQHIPSPRGRTLWSASTVREILTNPVYTGMLYAGRTRPKLSQKRYSALQPVGRKNRGRVETPQDEWVMVGQIDPLVCRAQFEAVQHKLAHGQQFARRNNTAAEYLVRSLISCGHCRLASSGRKSAGKTYYVCTGKMDPIHSGLEKRCSARFIPAEQLDQRVWADVCAILTQPAIIGQALQRAHGGEWLPQELQAQRSNLRKADATLVSQVNRLTDAYLAHVLTLDEYKRRKADIEQRQSSVAQQIKQLDMHARPQSEIAGLADAIDDFRARVQKGLSDARFPQKRQLVELLIDRVIVKDEEVGIRYVIPTSPKSELIRFCHLRTDYLVNRCSKIVVL